MKIIIEIEKDEEFEKIKKALKGEYITVVKKQKERKIALNYVIL